jgi:hypothetical protein
MRLTSSLLCTALVLGMPFLAGGSSLADESQAAWSVEKSSGEVWIATGKAEPVSLTDIAAVKPGDTVRTGENGMLLLRRGDETMLLSPNAVVEIPKDNKDGMSTTIFERAGSILLEVEKRKVNHFEVVTPYLAAVVKGTNFRVSVDDLGSRVEVLRGQVDVSDFPSGEQVLLLPGQTAAVASKGSNSLNLSGSGLFNPVRVGPVRNSPVQPDAPKARFAAAEPSAANGNAPAAAQPSRASASGRSQLAAVEPSRGSASNQSQSASQEYAPRTNTDKVSLATVGIPLSVGLLVSIGITARRGWKKRKKQSQAKS